MLLQLWITLLVRLLPPAELPVREPQVLRAGLPIRRTELLPARLLQALRAYYRRSSPKARRRSRMRLSAACGAGWLALHSSGIVTSVTISCSAVCGFSRRPSALLD